MSTEARHRERAEAPNAPGLGTAPAPGGPLFWAGAVVGLGIVGFGLYGLLGHAALSKPLNWLVFLLGGLAVHDAILMPCVALISVILVRVVPDRVRPVVQGTLVVAAVVALVAIPVVGGWGKLANNPSLLPLDYGRNLLVVLAAVVVVGVVLAVVRARRSPLPGQPYPEPDQDPPGDDGPRGW